MKQKVIFIASLVLVFLAGLGVMRYWDTSHLNKQTAAPAGLATLGDAPQWDLRQATEPDGMEEAGTPGEAQLATQSQLAPINMPEIQTIISRTGNAYETAGNVAAFPKASVEMGDAKYNTFPAAEPGGAQAEELPSSIVMIAAPVEPLLIKTTEEYKQFKRRARGSYPTADFSKHQVLVLESTSNLPDKVFEIQDVQEKDGKWLVTYRVSVFGLDKKTNTHTASLMPKKDLPLELKQVI